MDYIVRPSTQAIKAINPKIGLELGTSIGDNAETYYKELNLDILYLVDFDPRATKYMAERFKDAKIQTRILNTDSRVAAKNITETLDFVYIDANHDYDSVMVDICLWYPKIRKGGILAGHDYQRSNDVARALHHWNVQYGYIISIGQIPPENFLDWWITK
jgi:predicted O-methyltransferase YrrM